MMRTEHFNEGVSTPRPDADRNWMHVRAFGSNPMQQQGTYAAPFPNEEEQHRYLSEDAPTKKPSYDRGF